MTSRDRQEQHPYGLHPIKEVIERLHLSSTGKALSDEVADGELYDCPICRDAKFVHPVSEDGKVDWTTTVPCRCVREQLERKKTRNLLDYCELPVGTTHMTFENFKVIPELQEAYDLARELSEGSEALTWLTLMSDTGRGKTHLAIAVCRHWLERGVPAKYVYVPLLLEELRRGFREEGDWSYETRFDRFLNVPLLVLDDLGTENRTEWVQEKLDTIIDFRLVNGLRTLVTTNMTLDGLPFRIASRLGRLPTSAIVYIEVPEYEYPESK